MTEPVPGTEGYWRDVGADPTATDGGEPTTVRALLAEELDGDLRGLVVTRRTESAVYALTSELVTDKPVPEAFQLTTYVVDLDDDAVRQAQEPFWVPVDALDGLARLVGRGSGDLRAREQGDGLPAPLLASLVDGVDADLLLDREVDPVDSVDGQHVDKMKNHGGIDPARPWGYGAGPPPEVDHVVERLTEAGLDPSNHLSRLVWGKKEPMDRVPRPVDQLTGNYGVELHEDDVGLVAIDVDYPDKFPEGFDLPETFEVSSPHGDDRRRHILFRCEEKEAIASELGAWAVQGADWGDLWIGSRFLVGPGSQLSEFGCDNGEHTRGERGGCDSCMDPEGGYYRIVNDAPIATIGADVILDLLAATPSYALRTGRAEPDVPEPDDDQEGDAGPPACDNCGREPDDPAALKELAVGDSVRRICRGGCDR